jgi:hypothetical protein
MTARPTQTTTYTITCTDVINGATRTATDSVVVTVAGTTVSAPTTTPPSTKFKVGDIVVVFGSNANTRASANGVALGVHVLGDKGRVTGGSVNAGGYAWWNIDFETGVDGWVVEDFLTFATQQFVPISDFQTPPEIISFAASPQVISSGGSTRLSYNAKATNCDIFSGTDNLYGSVSQNGTLDVRGIIDVAPMNTWTYTLSCYKKFGVTGGVNSGNVVTGPVVRRTITVTVNDTPNPTISSFVASPTSTARPIQTLALTWNANAESCKIFQSTVQSGSSMGGIPGVSNFVPAPNSSNGTTTVSPVTSGSFTLVCSNGGKTVARSIPVTLEPYVTGVRPVANIVGWQNRSNNSAVVDVKINNQNNSSDGFVTMRKDNPFTVSWAYSPSGVPVGDVEQCTVIYPDEGRGGVSNNGSMTFIPSIQGQAQTLRDLWYPKTYLASHKPLSIVMSCMKGITDYSSLIQNGSNSSGLNYNQWFESSADTVNLKLTQ